MRRLRPPKVMLAGGALLGIIIVLIVALLVARTEGNTRGIETTCLLIVQTIRDSGANSGHLSQTPAAKAQRKLTADYTLTIIDLMPPSLRSDVARQKAIIRKAGGSIPEPQCRAAAQDPDKVRRTILQSNERQKATP